MNCGEILKLDEGITSEEVSHAVTGFMVDHIDKHGGNPDEVFFSVPMEGTIMRLEQ